MGTTSSSNNKGEANRSSAGSAPLSTPLSAAGDGKAASRGDAATQDQPVAANTAPSSEGTSALAAAPTVPVSGDEPASRTVSFAPSPVKEKFVAEGPSMSRAMTFDDRKASSAAVRKFDLGGFHKPLGRTATFIDHRNLRSLKESKPAMKYNDVLYRRFFGDGPKLERLPSLKGIVKEDYRSAEPEVVAPGSRDEAVVIVDTFSTGAMLAYNVYHHGYKVICALSGESVEKLLDMVPEGMDTQFIGTFVFDQNADPEEAIAKLASQIKGTGVPVLAVMAGAETGVELSDQLSEHMGLRTNGTALSEARRNKFIMGETVRAAGIRAVKQLYATKWGEISEFLSDWNPDPFKVIVKPVDSAGSEDVTLCLSLEDVQKAFGNIIGKVNGLGIVNKAVLVQEYLEGTEYIVDIVSRDGEHKVVAIWEYDRRLANGAPTVCFGYRLMSADEPRCRELMDYQRRVVTALGIRHGPTHGEVKWFKDEPVLVEVGARCQGGEGLFVKVANEALGYNQVDSAIASYLSAEDFAKIPAEPINPKKFGFMKWMCSFKEGTLARYNPDDMAELLAMESYRGHQWFIAPGGHLPKTRNCFSWTGCVRLVNDTKEGLQRDWDRIEAMQSTTLYELDTTEPLPPPAPKSCVVVVDPFSTGAMVAYNATLMGYRCIAAYSAELEQLDALTSLIPQGIPLVFDAIVGYSSDIATMAEEIKKNGWEILAVLAGAETGVELADKLSEHMGLRTNGTALSEARRNKFIMGETVRAAGIRAVKQLYATKWGEISEFLSDWNPDPFKVIVKPVDSAGSEDVTLCLSVDDVKGAFDKIIGKVNGLGIVNKAVLVQEYLEGTEYVIDIVSRDGEHKVVAIWEYERRVCNGASFVCFSQRLLTADEPRCRELMDYQRRVVTALGIRHGPTHGEVKWFKDEPVLVEVGARCHGMEGIWAPLADRIYGYNQINATLYAYLDKDAFDRLPAEPMKRLCNGRFVFIVSMVEGTLKAVNENYLAEMRAMPSFNMVDIFPKLGSVIYRSINCFTFGGVALFIHDDLDVVMRDVNRIREMENNGLFIVE